MAEFVLKSNYFELNGKVKQQLSATNIGTKLEPPYTCIFLDQVKTEFLESQVYNRCYDFGTQTTPFLFVFKVKKTLGYFSKT